MPVSCMSACCWKQTNVFLCLKLCCNLVSWRYILALNNSENFEIWVHFTSSSLLFSQLPFWSPLEFWGPLVIVEQCFPSSFSPLSSFFVWLGTQFPKYTQFPELRLGLLMVKLVASVIMSAFRKIEKFKFWVLGTSLFTSSRSLF